jgi:hypothetical protein
VGREGDGPAGDAGGVCDAVESSLDASLPEHARLSTDSTGGGFGSIIDRLNTHAFSRNLWNLIAELCVLFFHRKSEAWLN